MVEMEQNHGIVCRNSSDQGIMSLRMLTKLQLLFLNQIDPDSGSKTEIYTASTVFNIKLRLKLLFKNWKKTRLLPTPAPDSRSNSESQTQKANVTMFLNKTRSLEYMWSLHDKKHDFVSRTLCWSYLEILCKVRPDWPWRSLRILFISFHKVLFSHQFFSFFYCIFVFLNYKYYFCLVLPRHRNKKNWVHLLCTSLECTAYKVDLVSVLPYLCACKCCAHKDVG